MSFSLIYLVRQFFYRIFQFLRDWYAGGLRNTARLTLAVLEKVDKVLAWRVTFRNFFEPMYGDHTIIGHVLAFVFRSARLLIGAVVYPIAVAVAFTAYLVWALVPIYVAYSGFGL